MADIKAPLPITVNNIEVPQDIQVIIEDIINAYKEQRIIGIYRNADFGSRPQAGGEEQKIVIRIQTKK